MPFGRYKWQENPTQKGGREINTVWTPLEDQEGIDLHDFVPTLIAVVCLSVWLFFVGVHVLAIVYGKRKLHRRHMDRETSSWPGVSILKPLKGDDPNLRDNLESFFKMKYPKFELIFCVSSESDDSLTIVKNLKSKEEYTLVDAQYIITGGENVGVNPKINNMHPGYLVTKYNLILVSDAGIKMNHDTLFDMVDHMKDDYGLIHQMPYFCDRPSGFPATLEQIYFGTAHARIYLFANLLGINCATGMSALMKKECIENAGGLRHFGRYLAEDYFLAQEILNQGKKIGICGQPAWQNPGTSNIEALHDRMVRWTQLRLAMVFSARFEPLTECFGLGLIVVWAFYWLFDAKLALVAGLFHTLGWILSDWILISIIQNGPLPFTIYAFLRGWIMREWNKPRIFLRALLRKNIRWGGGEYRLEWGGIAKKLE